MSNIQVVAGADENELVAEVVTDGGSLVWMLTMPSGEGAEATMSDTELAQNLGYKEARAIRKTIKRLIDDRELEGVLVRDTVSRTRNRYGEATSGRTVQEYRLTLSQAITVAQASEAPKAPMVRGVLKEMFLHWRNGKLLPSPTTPEGLPASTPKPDALAFVAMLTDALVAALEPLKTRVSAVEARLVERVAVLEAKVVESKSADHLVPRIPLTELGVIGTPGAEWIKSKLAEFVDVMVPDDNPAARRKWASRAQSDLRAHVNYPSVTKGNIWPMLDASRFPSACRHLGQMIHWAKQVSGDRKLANQPPLTLFVVDGAKKKGAA